MFTQDVIDEITTVAHESDIEPAALLAVAYVESLGIPFEVIDGRRRPIIRWEGHYFYRLLENQPTKQARAVREGLAAPRWGTVKNSRSQARRWEVFRRAAQIDESAAIQSMSWGIGQVMGEHWKALGYRSPQDLRREAESGVAGQVRLMVRFIIRNNLVRYIEDLNWAGFARRYNGPAFAKNQYDVKMARAYAQFSGGRIPASSNNLRLGSRGKRVRELQQLLRLAGYEIKVDGDFGPLTEDAVEMFQEMHNLKVDGVVGPITMGELEKYRSSPDQARGDQRALEQEGVQDGLVGVGTGVAVEAARDTIEQTVQQTTGVVPEWLTTGLIVIAAGLAIFGAGYAIYSVIQSRRTKHGNKTIAS